MMKLRWSEGGNVCWLLLSRNDPWKRVRVRCGWVRTVFWSEAAAGHAGGYLCLEMEERAGGLDLSEEDACSRKGVQGGEL